MAYIRNAEGRVEMSPLPVVVPGKICVITESINLLEAKAGTFAQGNTGKIVRETLGKLDVNTDDIFFTAAVPYIMNKKNKVLTPERIKKERDRLIREIKESGAEIVLPLGSLVNQILFNKKSIKITKILGNILDIDELPDVKIIPNYHPAILIHSPGKYKEFGSIMQSAAKLYKGHPMSPGITKWGWVDTKEKLYELIDIVSKLDWVSADLETTPIGQPDVKIWVMGVWTAKNQVAVVPYEMFVDHPNLINKLFDTKASWTWHNGKYDTTVTHNLGYEKARLDDDTMYMHYTLNEEGQTHKLGQCSSVYLGAAEYKSQLQSQFKFIVDEENYFKYKQALGERVAVDTDYTGQLRELFLPDIEANEDHTKLYKKFLMPLGNFLRRVERRGLQMDMAHLQARIPKFEVLIADVTKEIQDAVRDAWDPALYMAESGAKSASPVYNPGSVPQTKWLIYTRMRLKPKHKGAKKKGTGAEILESIPNPPEFILKILERRKLKKEKSTYVQAYLDRVDKNDRIHPTFNPQGTTTGRLSCSNPNVQNVPSGKPEARRSFIPRGPNRIVMEVDYSGAELRVLAHASGDAKLSYALTHGDPHSEVAEAIYGEVWRNGTLKERKMMRGNAKTVNFGIAYGRGEDSIAEAFGVTKEVAKGYIETWATTYPDAWKYLQECAEAVYNGTPLITLWGRHRRFGLIHAANVNDIINEAKNFRIQSISSDNTLMAAMEVDQTLEHQYDAYIINLIHDSVLIDCPADLETVDAVSKLMSTTMINIPIKYYDCKVPFASDVDLGPNWGDMVAYDRETQMVAINKDTEIPYTEYQQKYII